MIYSHVIFQPRWPSHELPDSTAEDEFGLIDMHTNNRSDLSRGRLAYRGPLKDLAQRQEAFLATGIPSTNGSQLIHNSPLSRANKQLREDFSRFLHTAPLRVVARVENFDFRHILHFLSRLEEAQQTAFRVRHDGTSARSLILQLRGLYTEASLDNLQHWIEQIHAFAGPETHAELACLYKTAPVSQVHYFYKLIVNPLAQVHQKFDEGIAPGGGEIEAYKILVTLNASDVLSTHYHWWSRWGDDFQFSIEDRL